MIFAALLESGTGAVHAIVERIAHASRRDFGALPRAMLATVVVTGCIFVADRFGLVALIARGYRALAVIFLLVYVLPLLTIGVCAADALPLPSGGRMKRLLAIALLIAAPAGAAPPAGFAARVEALATSDRHPRHERRDRRERRADACSGFRRPRARRRPQRSTPIRSFLTARPARRSPPPRSRHWSTPAELGWDDRVIDRMPWFRMYDPWVTREMTIRDLLVHRSGLGLGEGDLLFVPRASLSRRESVHRLAYLKPATSFRSAFAYDNVLYMAPATADRGGHRPDVGGLRPRARVAPGRDARLDDRSGGTFRHRRPRPPRTPVLTAACAVAGTQERIDERDELGRNAAPAGGMAVSANDMAKWMTLQLAHGALPSGRRLFSDATATTMWTPLVFQPIADVPPDFAPTRRTSTAMPSAGTCAIIAARRSSGIRAPCSASRRSSSSSRRRTSASRCYDQFSEDGYIMRGLMYELLDHYLGLPAAGWPEKVMLRGAVTRRGRRRERQAGGCRSRQGRSVAAALRATPATMSIRGTAMSS